MKKLFLLIFVFILLALVSSNKPEFYAMKNFFNGNYSYYVNAHINSNNLNFMTINNAGLGSIVTCKEEDAGFVKNFLYNLSGESFSFKGKIGDVKKILNFYNAQVIDTEELNDQIFSIYASSNSFKNSILIDNKKINLQIAYNSGTITIGTPIILGSY